MPGRPICAVRFPTFRKALVATFLGGPPDEKQEAARAASPITYVSSGDPPMLLIQGTKDPLVPYDQAYQDGRSARPRPACRVASSCCWAKDTAGRRSTTA